MRTYLVRLLLASGLVTAGLAGCTAQAHVVAVEQPGYAGGPREAPPPVRVENHEATRPGFVWITGNYEWRGGRWEWIAGHWERERAGQRYRPIRWERRGDVWVRVDGDWVSSSTVVDVRPPPHEVSAYPTSEPPPLREEHPGPRPGMIFIHGNWEWRNGAWAWVDGRWESARSNQRFVEGRWERQGNQWTFVAGHWENCPEFPPLDTPPPAPKAESIPPQAGYFTIPGHWRWAGCAYEWAPGGHEKLRPGYHYQPGQWITRDNRFMWTNGDWVKDGSAPPAPPVAYKGPRNPPPAPREERVETKAGFVWARGHYEWRADNYEWIPGHWERMQASKTWVDARWEKRGEGWELIPGHWQ